MTPTTTPRALLDSAISSPAPAGGSKSRRASPRIVTTPLLRVFVAGTPISGNQIYGARGNKAARYLTPEARAWRESIAVMVMPWRYPTRKKRPDLAIKCLFIGSRADVDNLLKSTLDGLKDGLAVDDRYFIKVCAEKRQAGEGEQKGAWIEVSELPPVEAQRAPRKARNKRTA